MSEGKIMNALRVAGRQNRKKFAILLDPDEENLQNLDRILELANLQLVDYILVGGSLLTKDHLESCIRQVKKTVEIPVILFPGNLMQISDQADAILFMSLISGRNPEYLIGQQVKAAPMVKWAGLEVLPTGYILIDGGVATSVQYISHTMPIPAAKPELAACTALAGEMLGQQCIYLDTGSGAEHTVSEDMIREVRRVVTAPLFVGGGIKRPEQAFSMARAGADVLVVGNAIEKDPSLIMEIGGAIKDAEISI